VCVCFVFVCFYQKLGPANTLHIVVRDVKKVKLSDLNLIFSLIQLNCLGFLKKVFKYNMLCMYFHYLI